MATAIAGGAQAREGFAGIESAIVVGEFFAGGDIADGEFEVVADAEAVGGAGVVEEPGVVPAQDVVTAGVDVGVFFQLRAGIRGHRGDLDRIEFLVQRIERPRDSAAGDGLGGEYAPTDGRADKTKFSVGMDHGREFVREEIWTSRGGNVTSSNCEATTR